MSESKLKTMGNNLGSIPDVVLGEIIENKNIFGLFKTPVFLMKKRQRSEGKRIKNKGKSYSLALTSTLLVLFLTLVSSLALVAVVQGASPTITETRITTSGSAYSPAIYGDRIVWEDYRNGDWNRDIFIYNLSTSNETQITNSGSADSPAIYGNRIVWEDSQNGNSEIYVYDISTFQETQITTTGAAINPVIYGDRVVWMDDHLGVNYDIYMYDLSTSQETQITTSGSAYSPAIYGDRIVWYADVNGNCDIYMYDLSIPNETQITTSGSAACPAIYGDRILWEDSRNGGSEIYMYNLSTSKETQITTSGSAYSPAIYGDRMVWEDYRNGSYINESGEIYMYNISTFQETQITNSVSAGCPALHGDRIVWQDCRDKNTWDNSEIYMCTVSGEEPEPALPVANFSVNVTKGYVPLSVQFTDLSENATGWNWDFGDGANSTEQNPTHTYSLAGNYTVNLTVSNANGTASRLATITAVTYSVIPPQSISDIRFSTGSTWINFTWTNPPDSDLSHTEIYLNGAFQTNTSAEYFYATGLQPKTDYTIGTHTADTYGDVNETWVNLTATTEAPTNIYVKPDGSGDYPTIQAAVNNASSYDTIIVAPGTYTENVDVNVDNLTIRSESGSGLTTVQASNPYDHVFYVTANSVTISGFVLTGATGDSKSGIYLDKVEECSILNNIASNTDYGIGLYYSNNNTLENNTVNWNKNYGILLLSSSSNTLENNTASNTDYGGIGLYISNNNTLENNIVSNNYYGVYLYISSNNTLDNNTASNNDNGILLFDLSNNTLENNTVNWNKNYGICLSSSNSNTLESNTANSNTDCGIHLISSSNNLIFNNKFNNGKNTYFTGTNDGNVWNTTKTEGTNIIGAPYFGGNYWATPEGQGFSQNHSDSDGDGICDDAYTLCEGNIDYLPLVAVSVQPDTFILPLSAGWNLISIPLVPEDTSIGSVLSQVNGDFSIVWAYDASDVADPWKKYDPSVPFGNDLSKVKPGKGYWIMMTADDTLSVTGHLPEKSIPDMASGWNLIGYNSLTEDPVEDALSSVSGDYSIVWAYDASDSADPWKKYDPSVPFGNDLTEMEPGRGYWTMMN